MAADEASAGLSKLWRRAMQVHRAALQVDAGGAEGEGPAVPRIGVSAAALRSLLDEHAAALPAGATTADVVALVVKPATAGTPEQSFAEVLWAERSCAATGCPFVGAAHTFVSHAWANPFVDLVETLEAHSRSAMPPSELCAAAAETELYFWVGAPAQRATQAGKTCSPPPVPLSPESPALQMRWWCRSATPRCGRTPGGAPPLRT
jgi:hypothetical protein